MSAAGAFHPSLSADLSSEQFSSRILSMGCKFSSFLVFSSLIWKKKSKETFYITILSSGL